MLALGQAGTRGICFGQRETQPYVIAVRLRSVIVLGSGSKEACSLGLRQAEAGSVTLSVIQHPSSVDILKNAQGSGKRAILMYLKCHLIYI